MSSSGDKNAAVVAGPARRWLFGAAVFDELSLELRVSGQAVELERKPLEVLRHLLLHAGEVVTKDELAEACWPGRILSDSVLSKTLSKLREALSDEDQHLVKTVHGYGYRLVSPVKIEAVTAPVAPKFDFVAGDALPSRPLWKLQERLGTGGHGEAWLARHEKTREARVFKFALDGNVLSSLKREITLYRLLHDSLGEREDFVRLLDWNLNEAPYFTESEYSDGGNLQHWVDAQGGLQGIVLATRLDLAAQMAEALAAAHSVGVLHKDLKPGNVLISGKIGARPRIKLADFGSGGVLDPQRLEQLGITRLGFTQTLAAEDTSGTLHYVAPEVMAGQPSTVQADIYALGVMLYQLVIADLKKPLASGWEQDISDELLREDIAEATNGNPAKRIADASQIATRLRALEQRQRQRSAERQAAQQAEQAQRELERARIRRNWMAATVLSALIGLVVALVLYGRAERARNTAVAAQKQAEQARTEAERSAKLTEAVNTFLNQDLLSGDDTDAVSVATLTVPEMLDRAVQRVEKRFAQEPEARARIHQSLGDSYWGLGQIRYEAAHAQYLKALAAYERAGQRQGVRASNLLSQLGYLAMDDVRYLDARQFFEEATRNYLTLHGPGHTLTLDSKANLAWSLSYLGDYATAKREFTELLAQWPPDPASESDRLFAQCGLAYTLAQMSDFAAADQTYRRAVDRLLEILPPGDQLIPNVQRRYGHFLTVIGRFDEAERRLTAAYEAYARFYPQPGDPNAKANEFFGQLRLGQNRLDEALRLLTIARDRNLKQLGARSIAHRRIVQQLALTLQGLRRPAEALKAIEDAVHWGVEIHGPQHPETLSARMDQAGILLDLGRIKDARTVLDGIDAPDQLPPHHRAELYRQRGRLWATEGQNTRAAEALTTAIQLFGQTYGDTHWRTQRAQREFLALTRPGKT